MLLAPFSCVALKAYRRVSFKTCAAVQVQGKLRGLSSSQGFWKSFPFEEEREVAWASGQEFLVGVTASADALMTSDN